ncbi:MAG: hypothetical protein G01um101430_145 [Parcubacteria group bacterium Gr01-1014_30]|nr:MAG: hypothetical protein G01um101430_145 [Parcubacteria group bacterium Gr01-1014_30]
MLKCLSVKVKGGGFTLLEMMFAVFVVAVGLTGVISLIHRASFGAQIAASRLTAAYLAQEGVEIVRNIRDSNWLAQRDDPAIAWNQNLGNGDWEADYDDFTLTPFQNRNLKINGGFYNYAFGTDTKFKRKITITQTSAGTLAVAVDVAWQEGGRSWSVFVHENLYNWR